MMNQEIKKRWIEALRSGEYQQGKESLFHCGKFCCLGVLTDLYIKEHGLQWKQYSAGLWGFEEEGGVLPPSVRKWSGILDANPMILDASAADHNDFYAEDFATIADYIEKDKGL